MVIAPRLSTVVAAPDAVPKMVIALAVIRPVALIAVAVVVVLVIDTLPAIALISLV
jgi:hypothetical protein